MARFVTLKLALVLSIVWSVAASVPAWASGGSAQVRSTEGEMPTPAPTSTLTPTPTPDPGPPCPPGHALDSNGVCAECVFTSTIAWASQVWDAECCRGKSDNDCFNLCRFSTTLGVVPGYHHLEAGLIQSDVIVRPGVPSNSPAAQFLEGEFARIMAIAAQGGWDKHSGMTFLYRFFSEVVVALYPGNANLDSSAYFTPYNFRDISFSDIRQIIGRFDDNGPDITFDINGLVFGYGSPGSVWTIALDYDGNPLDTSQVFVAGQTSTLQPELKPGYVNCGHYLIRGIASPISLVMPGCEFTGADPKFAEFALDLAHPEDKMTTWFGSSCFPLLAEDQGQGMTVNSASQLFGNWTRGGRVAEGGKRLPWAHGYEALSIYDLDQSGAVEGAELDKFLLWTDANRNAVADPGEVVSAKSKGVEKLLYRNVTKFKDGYRLMNGYTSTVNGKSHTGETVDWLGKTAPTKEDLQALLAPNHKSRAALPDSKTKAAFHHVCSSETNPLTGVWRWHSSDAPNVTMGYLVLSDLDKGAIEGVSLPLVTNAAEQTITMHGFKLTGNPLPVLSSKPGSSREYAFSLTDSEGTTLSGMKLDTKTMSIEGKSTAWVKRNGKGFIYKWKATKVGCSS